MCPKMLIYHLSSPCRGFGINDGRLATAARAPENPPDDETGESKTNDRSFSFHICIRRERARNAPVALIHGFVSTLADLRRDGGRCQTCAVFCGRGGEDAASEPFRVGPGQPKPGPSLFTATPEPGRMA